MLTTLRRIVQEVSAAHDLNEALQIVVSSVIEAMDTEACSVFLTDYQHGENVLVATQGLNKSLTGKVRLKLGEGLVGLITERAELINLENASTHPYYIHYPGLGEEYLQAYLGVPIIHQRQVLGVLAVYQHQSRRFDESEEAFLVTLSAQLAGVITHALTTGSIEAFEQQATTPIETKEITLSGIAASPGIAIGQVVLIYPLADLSAVPDRPAEDIEREIKLLQMAFASARDSIKRLSENVEKSLPAEERMLFDAYLRILGSKRMMKEMIHEIRNGHWAQGALKRIIEQHLLKFMSMEDPYLKERATDLKDLGERVLYFLQQEEGTALIQDFPEQTILAGDEVTPAALAEVPEGKLVGVISASGSSNSHVAILARAMGIAAVMSVNGFKSSALEGKEIIIDGYYGQLHLSPSATVRHEFLELMKEEREINAELEKLRDEPAVTSDGHVFSLYVNTGLAADIGRSLSVGAEGVGLFRTEVPFMARDCFPSEEEQRMIYRQTLQAFTPKPVMMRTLDVGGDKSLPYFPVEEDNPFLGWRGIRITLDHPEIFLAQIRAMLSASVGLNNLNIMLPMVTSVSEVEESLRLLKQAYDELTAEGLPIKMPGFGVMVEVPSAVYQSQVLAKRVDFLSVGSNDLTQYILAIDRNNARVANLYDSLHPAVLRALMQVVAGAHREGKHASICGEMAGDPAAVILLLAIGFDTLSMSATRLPRVKWVIRNFSMKRARQLLDEVLAMDDAIEIRNHMELALEEAGLGSLMRAGR